MEPKVVVRRSARRTRSVSARRSGDHYVVDIPARFSRSEEREWVERMVARLQAKEQVTALDDDALSERAARLSARYLGGAARPTSVRWVDNQNSRWGSCTPGSGTIRISHRLQRAPDWVLDYVLMHELAHLVVADHSDDFWRLVAAYPRTERARGFLEGVGAAAWMDPDGAVPSEGTDEDDVTP
ncbi:MAG: M48 family metallopeptidase [Actinomycetales bacterium]